MSRSESFAEEASDSFSSYYRGYVDVEQRTPGTYRKRDLDALKRRQIGSDNRGGDSGDGRANLGFEQEPVIFARRNPPAYELELIVSDDKKHATPDLDPELDEEEDDMKRAPTVLRQGLAECLGTFLLVLLGDGAIAQYNMQSKQNGQQTDFLAVALGYGFALMIGILASGGVSGGHLNPAVTLAMAALRKCKWSVLPVYWAAQYLGAFLGAAVLYGTYADGINNVIGKNFTDGAAGIFASYPNVAAGNVTLVMDQALGTAILLVIILAVTDERNMKVASGLVAPLIGLGLAAIHISLAFNAGCAINPARDFSPRLFTLIAGFGEETFSTADYFFWIPWIMPHIGAVIGALTYYFMVEHHHPEDD